MQGGGGAWHTSSVRSVYEHMFDMHSAAVHREILRLTSMGINDCEVSRRTGIARATVRDIRRREAGEIARPLRRRGICPRCWKSARVMNLSAGDYVEMLALYLGDGYIVQAGRTFRLRIYFCLLYTSDAADE